MTDEPILRVKRLAADDEPTAARAIAGYHAANPNYTRLWIRLRELDLTEQQEYTDD